MTAGLFTPDLVVLFRPHRPCDYFDFPASATAFAESLGQGSQGSHVRVENNCIFFRQRGKILTLITYFCTGPELADALIRLRAEGFKIKSLNFVNKDFTGLKTQFYMNEYWVTSKYCIDTIMKDKNARRKNKFKNKMKRSAEKYQFVPDLKLQSKPVFDLFDDWVKQATSRHFMVIHGHYHQYLTRYFEDPKNVKLVGYMDGDNLHGIAGFETFRGKAQITIMKHRIGDNNFPVFFWFKTIRYIFDNFRVSKIFCGTTADKLKDYLKFQKARSYKIEIT